MKSLNKARSIIFIFSFLILSSFAWFIFLDQSIEAYFYTIVFSSLIYLFTIVLVYKTEIKLHHIFIAMIFVFIFKLLALQIEPVGSDDYYRYLWDGKVLVNGINPFQFPPNSESLNHLHSSILPTEVTYPNIKTIYFPLSQAAFALAYLIGGETVWGLKFILLFFDILLTAGLFLIFKKRKLDYKFILIYVLNPLIFYQFFVDAHIDLLGIYFFLFSIYFLDDRKIVSSIFLGASLMVKPTFIIALPILFFYEKGIFSKINRLIIPLILLAVSFIPFSLSANPFDTLMNYSRHWSFNGAVFNLFANFVNDTFTIRIILLILFFLLYFLLLRYSKNVISSFYYSLMFFLLLSPVIHPWYAAWLIVLLVIYPKFSGVTFVSLISLTFYTVMIYQAEGDWNEYPLIIFLEYIPVIVLLVYEIFFANKELSSGNNFGKLMPPEDQ